MTVKEIPMFTVICNGCGVDACDGTDYAAWAAVETVVGQADGDGWVTLRSGELAICESCLTKRACRIFGHLPGVLHCNRCGAVS
jgi:hypothetical protein